LAPKDDSTTTTDKVPFGAMAPPSGAGSGAPPSKSPSSESKGSQASSGGGDGSTSTPSGGDEGNKKDYRKAENKRGNARRGGRRRRKRKDEGGESSGSSAGGGGQTATQGQSDSGSDEGGGTRRGRRRRGRGRNKGERREGEGEVREDAPKKVGTGLFVSEKGGFGTLRNPDNQFLPTKQDIFVPQRLIQRFKLRDGSMIEGPIGKGKKYKFQLEGVTQVDGKEPKAWSQLRSFKSLTTIDPDFHYAVGDITDDVSMRILDLIAPIGRGQRGLIVAQPRTGKTTLMRQFAKGIEVGYPDVHLMVLLVDERPEEATEWVRSTKGQVFVSTSDETPKNHVKLAEAVWKRCQRLVEMGEDVVLILDSITRLARAYNNLGGGTGRTMSGGLDSRAMERPRQIFGSARNTERAGSLTILGTALVDTGSRMDQLIFEEFKGTGNMELVLNRKLADRRIFPAIDIEKSGTRKEEKIVTSRRLKRINTLRRVLLRMNFIEAMELLSDKLMDVEKTEDFLQRFDVDPEA